MLFKNITILDENLDVRSNMYVGVRGGRIDYIEAVPPAAWTDYGKVYDGRGKLLMSGFYNSHAHSPMSLLRGYGENLALQDWLNTRIFPFEDKLTGEAVYWGTMLSMAESLRFGIVSSTDMYYFCDDMAKAVLESGAKNNISRGIVSFGDEELWETEKFKECSSFFRQFHNAGDGRVLVDMSIHAEYTNTDKSVSQLADYAKRIGTRMQVHVSETREEHEECKMRHDGLTPVEYFHKMGVFDSPTTAAHCVWIEGEDFDILAEKGVTAASCPVSNLKLASGVCNVPELLKRGVNVAIGTDGAASNNSLNFIEEMKFFSVIHKGKFGDPTVITPKQTLYAATRAGALSQGREDCGKLAKGFRADLIVLDVNQPHMHPVHNLLNNLVYSADGRDVALTMVDGKVLYKDGEYLSIDVEKTICEAERVTQDILRQL